jgi:hypothetical protein
VSNDRLALEELFRVSQVGAHHTVRHYLYLPDARSGGLVAADLLRDGFAIEERVGADGDSWLVLATHTIIPSEETLARLRQAMEALAAQFGGEYDGWEAAVRSK